jgi:hypothetical protein
MSEKSLTVKEIINPDTFNIGAIDTSEIRALSESIPRDGNIDINNAEILAVKFLRGADLCGELLAIATVAVAKNDALYKSAYSSACIKATNKGAKTDQQRKWIADSDEEFLAAIEKYNEALGFSKWINSKADSFKKMHYQCKQLLERGYAHERMSNFSGDPEKMIKNGKSW